MRQRPSSVHHVPANVEAVGVVADSDPAPVPVLLAGLAGVAQGPPGGDR